MNYLLIVAVGAACAVCVWTFESIRTLQKQNAKLREDLERLRLPARLKGLTSPFARLAIPVHDVVGALKDFDLGMEEHEVFDRITKAEGRTLEDPSLLAYTVEVAGWRPEQWSAGLEIHGGRLTRVWLHALSCPHGTRGEVEADLRRRLGDPVPERDLASGVSAELKAKIDAIQQQQQATRWLMPVLGVEVSLTGASNVMLTVQLV